ncbi:MAG: DsrE family protein [Promethearchaeota archaeon]
MSNELKYCLYAFNGDMMCFVHVLLNALHMRSNDFDIAVVIEGSATKLIKTFHDDPNTPFYGLYKKVKESDMISAVCKACATKMGSLEAAEAEGLPIVGDMNGHPSMTSYIDEGYKIITF